MAGLEVLLLTIMRPIASGIVLIISILAVLGMRFEQELFVVQFIRRYCCQCCCC
jgi:hypothetical protein